MIWGEHLLGPNLIKIICGSIQHILSMPRLLLNDWLENRKRKKKVIQYSTNMKSKGGQTRYIKLHKSGPTPISPSPCFSPTHIQRQRFKMMPWYLRGKIYISDKIKPCGGNALVNTGANVNAWQIFWQNQIWSGQICLWSLGQEENAL